jgi:beta-N-acetylhexosaminidase
MFPVKKNLKITTLLLLNIIAFPALAQKESYIQLLSRQNQWVDSVFKHLSRKEKIAQLFFVRAHTNRGKRYEDSVANVIKKHHVGGLVFFQGGPGRQAILTNKYQKESRVPLLIAMDGEWGLGMRLDSTTSYPYQMTLGAIQDNSLVYKMGQQIAYDFKRIGAHMNFGPVMDVNNNPNNPVINYRSFGDNKYNVAQKGIAYMKGMQDAGLLTTAKHFPGHGDTNVDSHYDLPVLPFTRKRLDSLELYPFKEAINAGIGGIMMAHMNIPALDSSNIPSTLSRKIITNLLKDSLGFKGLVVSDAMEMRAVTKYYPPGEAEVKAFLAGTDIIELSENLETAILKIKKAIHKGQISMDEFNARVKKVLAAKYWAGLNNYKEAQAQGIVADLNREPAKELVQQLSDAAVTVLKGSESAFRLNPLQRTAIISIGVNTFTVFERELNKWYANSKMFTIDKNTPITHLNQVLEMLRDYDQVFVSINDTRTRPQSKLDYSNEVKSFISIIASRKNAVISVFANPYTLAGLPGIENCSALMVGYQMSDEMQRSAVKVITGRLKPTGKLPVSINTFFTTGAGLVL